MSPDPDRVLVVRDPRVYTVPADDRTAVVPDDE